MMEEPQKNPMDHPEEQPTGSDDRPKFGRLLIVLVSAVLALAALSYLSAQYYS